MKILCKKEKIHYKEYGTGTPVLFIHGWAVDMRLWSGCTEPLFQQNPELDKKWRRIYIDLPGCGGSPTQEGVTNADGELAIILEFMEKVLPDEKFALAGESYGGYLSLGLIREIKERILGLFLLCPFVVPDKKTQRIEELTVLQKEDSFEKDVDSKEWEGFYYFAAKHTKEAFDAYLRDIDPGVKAADWNYLDNILEGRFSFDKTGRIKDYISDPFDRPSLILTGRQDNAVGFKDQFDLMDLFPRASYGALDMAGHNLQSEQIPLYNAFVENWLDRILI